MNVVSLRVIDGSIYRRATAGNLFRTVGIAVMEDICVFRHALSVASALRLVKREDFYAVIVRVLRDEKATAAHIFLVCIPPSPAVAFSSRKTRTMTDRKSTRLNSSHVSI